MGSLLATSQRSAPSPETTAAPAEPGWSRRRWAAVLAECTAVAVLTLRVPATLNYDPWSWLVWGREIVRFDLDTTGGPAWKPLPVLFAVPLAPLGDLAPLAWQVLARVGALLTFVGVYRLATRLAGPVAGAIAAGLLVLTPDTETRYVRLLLEGHSAPFTAALAVWAVERHLAGRRWATAVLLFLLGLDRPEAWPFLGLYALWLARREPERRLALAALLAAIPLLWFVPEWWGSGSPLHGASTAQVYAGRSDRYGLAAESVLGVVVAPAWALAVAGGVALWRRGRRDVGMLVALALGWMGLVVGMSVLLGYASLPRFQLPGGVLVGAAAATAAVVLVRTVPPGRKRAAAVTAALLVAAPFVVQRAVAVRSIVDEVVARGREDRDLAGVLDDAGGLDHLRTCGPLMINSSRSAVAWRADVPLHDVIAVERGRVGVAIVPHGSRVERRLAAAGSGAVVLARRGRWLVFDVQCRFGGEG